MMFYYWLHIKIVFSADLFKFLGSSATENGHDDARRKAQAAKLGHEDDNNKAGGAPDGNVACVKAAAAHRADAVEQYVYVAWRAAWIFGLEGVYDDGPYDGY